MAQATFSIRMDETLKRQFDALCADFGMNATTAFNIFARAVVRERKIPFFRRNTPTPPTSPANPPPPAKIHSSPPSLLPRPTAHPAPSVRIGGENLFRTPLSGFFPYSPPAPRMTAFLSVPSPSPTAKSKTLPQLRNTHKAQRDGNKNSAAHLPAEDSGRPSSLRIRDSKIP